MNSSPILLSVLLLTSAVQAEELSGTEASAGEDVVAVAPAPVIPPAKSQLIAHALAFSGTVIPLALWYAPPKGMEGIEFLAGMGVLVGPSLGQFYAGSNGTALAGQGVRVLGALILGFVTVTECLGSASDNCGGDGTLGRSILYSGIAFSLIETSFAVNRANERARKKAGVQTSFAPALFPTSEGRFTPGLALSASF